DRAPVLGEGRRVEYDRVEAFAGGVVIAQQVEGVGRDEFDVCDVIEFGVAARAFNRPLGDVDGGDALAALLPIFRERALETETIKPAPARVTHSRRPILALIQERAGLLPSEQVDPESNPVLGDKKIIGRSRPNWRFVFVLFIGGLPYSGIKQTVDHRKPLEL